MKRIYLPLIVLMSVLCMFTSCSDDDGATLKDNIIGTWSTGEVKISVKVLGVPVPGANYTMTEATGELWEFTTDGRIILNNSSYYEYTINGKVVTVTYADNTTLSFNGSISGGTLILSSSSIDGETLSALFAGIDNEWLQLITPNMEISVETYFYRTK